MWGEEEWEGIWVSKEGSKERKNRCGGISKAEVKRCGTEREAFISISSRHPRSHTKEFERLPFMFILHVYPDYTKIEWFSKTFLENQETLNTCTSAFFYISCTKMSFISVLILLLPCFFFPSSILFLCSFSIFLSSDSNLLRFFLWFWLFKWDDLAVSFPLITALHTEGDSVSTTDLAPSSAFTPLILSSNVPPDPQPVFELFLSLQGPLVLSTVTCPSCNLFLWDLL